MSLTRKDCLFCKAEVYIASEGKNLSDYVLIGVHTDGGGEIEHQAGGLDLLIILAPEGTEKITNITPITETFGGSNYEMSGRENDFYSGTHINYHAIALIPRKKFKKTKATKEMQPGDNYQPELF